MEELKVKLSQELVDLDTKLTNLETFINNKEEFKKLDFPTRMCLRFQKWSMARYWFWLSCRMMHLWPMFGIEDFFAIAKPKPANKSTQKKKNNKQKKTNE